MGAVFDTHDEEQDVVEDNTSKQSHPFYCPGCGARYNYMRECIGRREAPHAPIDVISTDELNQGPEHWTAAPNTGV